MAVMGWLLGEVLGDVVVAGETLATPTSIPGRCPVRKGAVTNEQDNAAGKDSEKDQGKHQELVFFTWACRTL
jgi:hypothetical protein